jgi:hypothetical protein
VIIDARAASLTNFHVAGRAAEIYVTLFNKERVPARLVGETTGPTWPSSSWTWKTSAKKASRSSTPTWDEQSLIPGRT